MFATGESPVQSSRKKASRRSATPAPSRNSATKSIAANPGPAADFKAGKVAALNFLKGQVMKLSKGKANPALVGEILERKLKA